MAIVAQDVTQQLHTQLTSTRPKKMDEKLCKVAEPLPPEAVGYTCEGEDTCFILKGHSSSLSCMGLYSCSYTRGLSSFGEVFEY